MQDLCLSASLVHLAFYCLRFLGLCRIHLAFLVFVFQISLLSLSGFKSLCTGSKIRVLGLPFLSNAPASLWGGVGIKTASVTLPSQNSSLVGDVFLSGLSFSRKQSSWFTLRKNPNFWQSTSMGLCFHISPNITLRDIPHTEPHRAHRFCYSRSVIVPMLPQTL